MLSLSGAGPASSQNITEFPNQEATPSLGVQAFYWVP